MKIAILDGAGSDGGTLAALHASLVAELDARGWEHRSFILREMDVKPCRGCFGCWVQTPGMCIVDDASREVSRAIVQSDLLIYLTPVTFGGYSYELKKVLDRSICNILPFFKMVKGEIHHVPRYERYPRLLGVGTLPQPDAESERIFTTLIERNAINMHCPAHAAGVVFDGEGPEQVERKLHTLLTAVEVT